MPLLHGCNKNCPFKWDEPTTASFGFVAYEKKISDLKKRDKSCKKRAGRIEVTKFKTKRTKL